MKRLICAITITILCGLVSGCILDIADAGYLAVTGHHIDAGANGMTVQGGSIRPGVGASTKTKTAANGNPTQGGSLRPGVGAAGTAHVQGGSMRPGVASNADARQAADATGGNPTNSGAGTNALLRPP